MLRKILTAIIIAMASMSAIAQSDLQIDKALRGKYVNDSSVTEIVLSGEQKFLKRNKLDTFVSFKGDAKTYCPILQPLVLEDGSHAVGRDVRYKDGVLQYAFYMLRPLTKNGRVINRYIYYIYNSKKSRPSVRLIYLEGVLTRNEAAEVIMNK